MAYQQHKLEESLEDYLEAILMLQQELGNVRSIDIARKLGFSKPSISVAMKNIKQQGLIDIDESGHISLTESGLKWAKSILERHSLLSKWLIWLGVDPKIATNDACKLEHDLSPESFAAIKDFLSKTIK